MRTWLRRAAWMLARLALIVSLAFAFLTKAIGEPTVSANRGPTERATQPLDLDFDRDGSINRTLPLFYNPRPVDLTTRLQALQARAVHPLSDDDERWLVRLGAASFPVLAPSFASLPPTSQVRLADALESVLARMGQLDAGGGRGDDAHQRLLAVMRELGGDFRPTIARRRVERLRDHGQPSHAAKVAELDTYALPALLGALRSPQHSAELPGIRRLTLLLCHITGRTVSLPEQATLWQARAVVSSWQRWWMLHEHDFSNLDGPERISARLTQTQFAEWVRLALFHGFGTDPGGHRVTQATRAPALLTLLLVSVGWLGHATVTFLSRLVARRAKHREWLHILFVGLGALPLLMLLPWFVPAGSSEPRPLLAVVFAAMAGVLQSAFSQSRLARTLDLSFGAPGELRSVLPEGIPQHSTSFFLTSSDWPWLLLATFVIERFTGQNGLGTLVLLAVENGDLNSLMAVTTLTAFGLLVVEFLAARPARRVRP
jgi:hypothetical protein